MNQRIELTLRIEGTVDEVTDPVNVARARDAVAQLPTIDEVRRALLHCAGLTGESSGHQVLHAARQAKTVLEKLS